MREGSYDRNASPRTRGKPSRISSPLIPTTKNPRRRRKTSPRSATCRRAVRSRSPIIIIKQKQFRAAVVYYNDVIRQQPNSPDSTESQDAARRDPLQVRREILHRQGTRDRDEPQRRGQSQAQQRRRPAPGAERDGQAPRLRRARRSASRRRRPRPVSTAGTGGAPPTRVNPLGCEHGVCPTRLAGSQPMRPRRTASRSRRPCRKASSPRCRRNKMKAERLKGREVSKGISGSQRTSAKVLLRSLSVFLLPAVLLPAAPYSCPAAPDTTSGTPSRRT